jgi:hypothetical protein
LGDDLLDGRRNTGRSAGWPNGLPRNENIEVANRQMNPDLRPMTPDQKPPVFSSWKGWYALLIAVLAVLVVGFYVFTEHYS